MKIMSDLQDAHELLPIPASMRAHFGVVYFVQSGQFIKIGHSKKWPERLSVLQTGSPMGIEVLHVEVGPTSKERALHRRFGMYRYRGEWFHASAALFDFIESRKGLHCD
jgi:hypothetical protein